jgi:hypothetical protein
LRIRRAISALGEPPFAVLALLLLAVFVVTRLPFFWYFPRVDQSLDSRGYLEIATTMRERKWPSFLMRTPGYPVLIWLVTSCVDRWLAVVLVQNLLSFVSALCVAYAVYRLRRPLALPATLAMCGFLGSSQVLFYDISLLSESLYTSMTILAVAGLILAFALDRAAVFALASAFMAMAVLVRPAAEYLAVIYLLVLGFLAWNRRRPRAILAFAAPFPALLLGLCAYNYAMSRQFVISAYGEANLAGATALFWEPDPRLPAQVNKALEGLPESLKKIGVSEKDLNLVRTSWDTEALFEVYAKAYNRIIWSAGWGMGSRFGAGTYVYNRNFVRDTSVIAIRRHPSLYAKFVWVNLVEYFGGIGYKFDLDSSLEYRATAPLPTEVTPADLTAPEGRPAHPTPPRRDSGAAVGDASGLEYLLKKLGLAWQGFHGAVFQNVAWSWAWLAVMVLSLVRLVASRGRHQGAFLLFALTLIPLGASLVVCMVEVALDRYSYPTQFICYLSVALCPLLWGASGAGAARAPARASGLKDVA